MFVVNDRDIKESLNKWTDDTLRCHHFFPNWHRYSNKDLDSAFSGTETNSKLCIPEEKPSRVEKAFLIRRIKQGFLLHEKFFRKLK